MKNLIEFENVINSGGKANYSLSSGSSIHDGLLVTIRNRERLVRDADVHTEIKKYIKRHGIMLNDPDIYITGSEGVRWLELNMSMHFDSVNAAVDYAMQNYSEITDLETGKTYDVPEPKGVYNGDIKNAELEVYQDMLIMKIQMDRAASIGWDAFIPIVVVVVVAVFFYLILTI